ncbi:hypothetical protein ACVIGB_000709 [Bradyrhizobium sp. USDA 4341]
MRVTNRNRQLLAAELAFEKARARLKSARKLAAGSCKHPVVYQARLLSDGPNPFGRICSCCSYEEHAWWWPATSASSPDREGSFRSKLNGAAIECSKGEFYSFR